MSETAAASETPAAENALGAAVTTTTTDAPKPEKAPALEDILAEPGDEIDPKKLPKARLQERFSELTTKQKEAMARAEAAEARLKEIADREAAALAAEQARRDAEPRPKREQFDDPDAYDEALVKWTENKAKREGAQAERQKFQQEAAARDEATVRDVFATKIAEFKTVAPDFEEVAFAPGVTYSELMARTVQRIEKGPEIAYHLGKNPQIAAKIAAMTPAAQLFELGQLSATVTRPAAPSTSKAPPPIRPVGSRSSESKNPDDMSGDEYFEMRQAQMAAARKR